SEGSASCTQAEEDPEEDISFVEDTPLDLPGTLQLYLKDTQVNKGISLEHDKKRLDLEEAKFEEDKRDRQAAREAAAKQLEVQHNMLSLMINRLTEKLG
ncbi:hypothetical protein CYMTET_33500, partial [Cymbomonas tetramitiformis]